MTLQKREREAYEQVLRSALESMGVDSRSIAFLFDLMTPSERMMFARRIEIAKRLLVGQSFLQIKHNLKVGLDTIQFVNAWLQEGCEDYRSLVTPQLRTILEEKQKDTDAMKKLRAQGTKPQRRRRPPPYACNFIELCKHYPCYGGFFSLLFEENW